VEHGLEQSTTPLRLRTSAAILEADWLSRRLRPFGSEVAAVVPDGFPAYIRIQHPVRETNGEPTSWADVAAWSGRTMHRLAQFHAISSPRPRSVLDPVPWEGASPPDGNLPADLLRVLCSALAGHTSAPDSCWFCLWDGYGWLRGSPAVSVSSWSAPAPPLVAPALPPEALQGPRVRLPNREYVLLEGPLEAATELGWTIPWSGFIPQSPNLFWPRDHAWCVASEIDLFCTLVAGSQALAEVLLADSRLEAWRVEPGDPIRSDSDVINT